MSNETVILVGIGFNDLKFGASQKEVREFLGEPDDIGKNEIEDEDSSDVFVSEQWTYMDPEISVHFDLEDDGNIPGYDWIMGSRHFVENLNEYPDKVVIIDMIGDKDLNIYKEFNSNKYLTNTIWNVADELGYKEYFIHELKYRILDDHIPFIEKGIQSIDIIDFDYPYWHTIRDTKDKVSPESLNIVGDVLLNWLQK